MKANVSENNIFNSDAVKFLCLAKSSQNVFSILLLFFKAFPQPPKLLLLWRVLIELSHGPVFILYSMFNQKRMGTKVAKVQ